MYRVGVPNDLATFVSDLAQKPNTLWNTFFVNRTDFEANFLYCP